jgi:hypothetical protein
MWEQGLQTNKPHGSFLSIPDSGIKVISPPSSIWELDMQNLNQFALQVSQMTYVQLTLRNFPTIFFLYILPFSLQQRDYKSIISLGQNLTPQVRSALRLWGRKQWQSEDYGSKFGSSMTNQNIIKFSESH